MRLDDHFARFLAHHDLNALTESVDVTFGIYPDGRLAYTNDAWDRFAAENGAPDLPGQWPLGRTLFDAVPDDLQSFYRDAWEWALEAGHPWSHAYDCSSPDQQPRLRMTVYPLNRDGLLVVNSIVAEALMPDGDASDRDREEYLEGTVLTQCSHCRRTRHPQSGRWDWVPEWVNRWPSNARATLCEPCAAYHEFASMRLVRS